MRDVISKHHPEFKASKDLTEYGLRNPSIFDIELLMDQCLSAVGGYRYVDEVGRDFNDPDNSDGKTSTVRSSDNRFSIRSVESKIGSLRVTAWNEILDKTHFFYIPTRFVAEVKTWAGMGKKEWIVSKWSPVTRWYPEGHYNKLNPFRVADFETLSTVTDTTFQVWNP